MKLTADANNSIGRFISILGNATFPIYLIKGATHNLLVDAGINALGPLYLESIERLLGDSRNLDFAFVTHSHYDHLGSIPYLKRKIPQLKLGAFGTVTELVRKPSVLRLMNRLSDAARSIFPEVVGDEDVHLEAVEFDLALKEGDTFELGGLGCEVYEVPGHTRDSLAYFIPELRALFAAEAVGVPDWTRGDEVHVQFLASYSDYLRSIEKMMALRPRVIGMAHNWVFTDDDAMWFLEKSYKATPEYRALIEEHLDRANGNVEKTIEMMVRGEYEEKDITRQERNAFVANLTAQVRHIASMRG